MGHHGQMHAEAGVGMRPEAPDPDRPELRHLPATSFRSRRSALSGAQHQTWERLWPRLGLSLVSSPGGPGPEPLDTRAWFGRPAPHAWPAALGPGRRAPLVLEIGCGTGTSTLA